MSGLLPAVDYPGRDVQDWGIDNRMARYKTPGVSMAVIHEGSVDWVAGFGSVEAHSSAPVMPSTSFQAASISKLVAAAGMLHLVDRDFLVLDENVNLKLQSWKTPSNEFTEQSPVTLRALLSHSAGVTVHGFPGYENGETLPGLVQILNGSEPANSPAITIDQVPGASYRYSGGGYEIAELLVEDVMDRPFEQVMEETILAPLGMANSTFVQPPPDEITDGAAHGHRFDGSPVSGGWYVYPEQAAAGLWTTPSDLARFVIELISTYHGETDALFAQPIARDMLKNHIGKMGLGAGVHGEGQNLHFDHAGWSQGFRTYLVAYPYSGDGVIVMTNSDGGHELIREILRGVAVVYEWPDFRMEEMPTPIASLTTDRLDQVSGTYEFTDAGFSVVLRRQENHLVLDTPRGSYYTFYPQTETQYVAIENGSVLKLVQEPDGSMSMHLWGMSGRRP
jgi:CubicO group peptidase (beta-lactamase class C family)